MFLRGDGHAWVEEVKKEAIRGRGRNTLPSTEREKEGEMKTVNNRGRKTNTV